MNLSDQDDIWTFISRNKKVRLKKKNARLGYDGESSLGYDGVRYPIMPSCTPSCPSLLLIDFLHQVTWFELTKRRPIEVTGLKNPC